MTEEINRYFNESYAELVTMAKGKCFKKNRKIPPDIYVTNAYTYLISIAHKIPSTPFIERYAKQYICREIEWTNSSINLKYTNAFTPNDTTLPAITLDDNDTTFGRIDIYSQLLEELKDDKINQIVFDCYVNKGINSVRKISTHFDINRDAAHKVLITLKKKLHEKSTKIKAGV